MDYDDAVSTLLHAARGGEDAASDRAGGRESDREPAPVISLYPTFREVSSAFPDWILEHTA